MGQAYTDYSMSSSSWVSESVSAKHSGFSSTVFQGLFLMARGRASRRRICIRTCSSNTILWLFGKQ